MLPSLPTVPPRRPGAQRRVRWQAPPTFGLLAAVGLFAVVSCTDVPITGAPLGSIHGISPSVGDASASSAPIGIGGSYTLTAGGIAVSGVPPAPTGIFVPAGIPVRVEVSGVITRTQTAGLQEFCALPRWQPSCAGAWASIIAETPIGPSGLDFWPGRAAALVAWAGGAAASPEPGSTSLSGTSGGELQFGRTGWGCYYSDTEDDLSGNCFTFGGDFTVTVRADPGSDPDGDGIPDALDPDDDGDGIPDGEDEDHGGAEDPSWLTAAVESSVPVGGSTDATVVAKYREGASVSDFVWSFVPDVVSTVSGDTVAEMETANVTAAVRGEPPATTSSRKPRVVGQRDRRHTPRRGTRAELPPGIERIDATHVRLPDGRIVGPGLHLYEIPAPAEQRGAAQPSLRRFGGKASLPAMSMANSASGAMSLSGCNAMSVCGAFVPATRGTFVVTAMVDGKPRSASARLEEAPELPAKLIVDCDPYVMRGAAVHCRIRMEPAKDAMITRLQSLANGAVLVDQEVRISLSKTKPEYDWTGIAVASTTVKAWVTANERASDDFSASGSFSVGSRMGSAEWPYEDPPKPFPPPVATSGPPLKVPYPHFTSGDGGWLTWTSGSIGASLWPLEAGRFKGVMVGPNAGTAFVTRPPILDQAATRSVYAISMAPGDPFYLLQTGGVNSKGQPYCGSSHLDRLRGEVIHHENGHGVEQQKELDAARAALESEMLYLDLSSGASPLGEQVGEWFARLELLHVQVPMAVSDSRMDSGVGPYPLTSPMCVARWH